MNPEESLNVLQKVEQFFESVVENWEVWALGLGILAAAKALDLDFVPLEREQYDLVIPSSMLANPNVQFVLETIRSEDFKARIMALGGYDSTKSGELWQEIG